MNRIRPIQRAKNILRKEMVRLLVSLSEDEKRKQSVEIHTNMFKLPVFQESLKIACYCSTISEVDTRPIIEQIFKLKKHLYVPRYSYRFKKMFMERLQDMNDYENVLKRKGVIRPQPKYSDNREDAFDVGGLDLIIANGLAFTQKGKRLGTGGGYYDDYIKRHRKAGYETFSIGLGFKEQIFPYLPTHYHDVDMNIVLYPSTKKEKYCYDFILLSTDLTVHLVLLATVNCVRLGSHFNYAIISKTSTEYSALCVSTNIADIIPVTENDVNKLVWSPHDFLIRM